MPFTALRLRHSRSFDFTCPEHPVRPREGGDGLVCALLRHWMRAYPPTCVLHVPWLVPSLDGSCEYYSRPALHSTFLDFRALFA